MSCRAVSFGVAMTIAISCVACKPASRTEVMNQEPVDDSLAGSLEDDNPIAGLRSQISDLEERLTDAEAAVKKAQDQADEAHSLAEEAGEKAGDACKPYGYQYGCGNSGN